MKAITIFKSLVCILLLALLTLGVCACDGAQTETTDTPDATTAAPEEESTAAPEKESEEQTEEQTQDAGTATYKITVVDASGAPVANVPVQLCTDLGCQLPVPTGADGVALITAVKDSYTAKAILADGSTTSAYEFNDAGEVTITLP